MVAPITRPRTFDGCVERTGELGHRRPVDLRVPVSHNPQVAAEHRSWSPPSRIPGSARASGVRCVQQGHREQQLLVRGGRPLLPGGVAVEPVPADGDRDGHVVPVDGPVDVPNPAWGPRSAGPAPGSRNAATTATTVVRTSVGRRGTRGGDTSDDPAAEGAAPDRSAATMPGTGTGQPAVTSTSLGRSDGCRLRASWRRLDGPRPDRRRASERAVTTIDRERLSGLMERERALFRERHPKSRSLFEAGRARSCGVSR